MRPKVFDTIKQAAAVLKIPEDVLRKAKGLGCPNFRGGRVYPDSPGPIGDWLKAHEEAFKGGGSLRDQKLSEEVRKLRIKNDRDSGVLVTKARIIQFFSEFAGEFRGQLHQVLENEYPTAVAGMDPPQARILGKRLADKLDDIAMRHAEKLSGI